MEVLRDLSGPCRHDDNSGCEHQCFIDGMCDKEDGLLLLFIDMDKLFLKDLTGQVGEDPGAGLGLIFQLGYALEIAFNKSPGGVGAFPASFLKTSRTSTWALEANVTASFLPLSAFTEGIPSLAMIPSTVA